MTLFVRSSIRYGANQRSRRASSRGRRPGEENSSAQRASSDARASIGPIGVSTAKRHSCIGPTLPDLDEMADNRALLLDKLPDALVREVEQRHERAAAERLGLRRAL